MQTIGLLGGMSWFSTLDYYRVINEATQQRFGEHHSAPISLQSLDFAEVRALQVEQDWHGAGRLLAQAARRCQDGGADLVLICTNLMHRVADQVAAAIDVPLLHIADALSDRARAIGADTVGVLGTRWTMEGEFYLGRLREAGLGVVVPDEAARGEIDRMIFDELTQGVITDSSRDYLATQVAALADAGADAVILGCTELQLLITQADTAVPLLDSMRVHAEAAVAWACGD